MLSGNNDKNSKEIPSIVLNGIKNIPENYSLPKLHGSECFKATLIRLAIPGVFIAICLLIITTAPAQSDSTVLQGWIAFAIVFAIWWVAHWYFAKWKNANKQNNPTPYPRAFITLGKGISALILFYLFTIFLELLSLTDTADISNPITLILGLSWDITWRSGMPLAILFMVIARACSNGYKNWCASERKAFGKRIQKENLTPVEALEEQVGLVWWLDEIIRVLVALANALGAVGILVALLMHSPITLVLATSGLFSPEKISYISFTVPWFSEFMTAIGQLSAAGMWVFVLTAGIVRIVWRKFLDWSALNTAEEIQAIEERKRDGEEEPQFECIVNGEKAPGTEVPNVGVYLQGSIIRIGRITGWISLVLGCCSILMSLLNPALNGFFANIFQIIGVILSASALPIFALILFVVLVIINACELRWYEGTNKTHKSIHSFMKTARYVGYAICLLCVGYALVMAQLNNNIIGLITQNVAEGVNEATIWTLVTQLIVESALYLVIIAVLLYAAYRFIDNEFILPNTSYNGGYSGSYSGGYSGGSFGGSSGGNGGSSYSGSPWGNPYSTTYVGGKAYHQQNNSWGGSTIYDGWGSKVGSTRQGVFGNTKVEYGGQKYEVRDGIFGDKIVTDENGKEVGRITEGLFGNNTFKKS